ncbi:hypothetical protein SAMN04488136_11663 [Vibrio xiamenensis]|uniref:Uncharacterized protein n=1 Tax=Vibrio xiamenensis TaxID=861298 RepID=A0A1G8CIJ8_9VIBR|nr:hypothetical protein [Vibrio xiamenensis]SDH44730.1 hypothetical protein SAMN04488136_11663 [Vibrio xiamenensis]
MSTKIKKITTPLTAIALVLATTNIANASALNAYEIAADQLVSTEQIERSYLDGFTLEDVDVRYVKETESLVIENGTPRYLHEPIVEIDGKYHKVISSIGPFETQTFHLSDADFSSLKFVDEQPFFKINNPYYESVNEKFPEVTEFNTTQYEQEMRALKNALNDFDLNVQIASYITDYGTARSASTVHYHEDGEACESEHNPYARWGTDESPKYTRLLTLLNYQPQTKHRMLVSAGYYGTATLGNGFLSVREGRLWHEGWQYPTTTYLHEKMHNHGFSHAGGMTYGVPELLVNYVKAGNLSDYYNTQSLAATIPTAAVKMDVKGHDADTMDLQLRFMAPADQLGDSLKRFMVVVPASVEVEQFLVTQDGVTKEVQPDSTYADGRAYVFENDLDVKLTSIESQGNENTDNLITLRIQRPAAAQYFTFLGTGSKDTWSRQINMKVQTGFEHGYLTDDGQAVFVVPASSLAADGSTETVNVQLTPSEAIEFCQANGLELGYLPEYKSVAQMDFQMKYLPYKSQVGLDPETHEPVSVFVDSSYRPEYVNYNDKGELIVCQ